MSAEVFRCRVCRKRIPQAVADRALSRGKVPAYCAPPAPCRNTGKARIRRAHKAQSSVDSEGSNGVPEPFLE